MRKADIKPGVVYARCEMPVAHMEDLADCGERSRYRLELVPPLPGFSPAESCPRHLPEMLFDLAGSADVAITVTLHYDGPEAGE